MMGKWKRAKSLPNGLLHKAWKYEQTSFSAELVRIVLQFVTMFNLCENEIRKTSAVTMRGPNRTICVCLFCCYCCCFIGVFFSLSVPWKKSSLKTIKNVTSLLQHNTATEPIKSHQTKWHFLNWKRLNNIFELIKW